MGTFDEKRKDFISNLQENKKITADEVSSILLNAFRNFNKELREIKELPLTITGYIQDIPFFCCENGNATYLVTENMLVKVSPNDEVKYSEDINTYGREKQKFTVSDYSSVLITKNYKSGDIYTERAEELSENPAQAMDFLTSSSKNTINLGEVLPKMFFTTRLLVQETQDAKTITLARCLYESRQAYINGEQPVRVLIDKNTFSKELGIENVSVQKDISKSLKLENGTYVPVSDETQNCDDMSLEEIQDLIRELRLPEQLSPKMNNSINGKLPQEVMSALGVSQSSLLKQLSNTSNKNEWVQE